MDGGVVIFGDNKKERIIGIDNIYIISSTFIQNMLLVNGLKYNLLSIVNFVVRNLKFFSNHHCALFLIPMIMASCLLDIDIVIST